MTLATLLLAGTALACTPEEPCPDHAEALAIVVVTDGDDDEADDCEDRGCRRKLRDPGYLALRSQWVDLGARSAWGLEVRGRGRGDGWIGAEGRWADDDAWMGRVGAGFDIFPRSAFDLGLGLVGGHIADWQTAEHHRFAVGTEVVVGWQPGRFVFEHRHLGGRRPEGGIRTENHTRLGFLPWKMLELAVDFTAIDPGRSGEYGVAFGVGLRL